MTWNGGGWAPVLSPKPKSGSTTKYKTHDAICDQMFREAHKFDYFLLLDDSSENKTDVKAVLTPFKYSSQQF